MGRAKSQKNKQACIHEKRNIYATQAYTDTKTETHIYTTYAYTDTQTKTHTRAHTSTNMHAKSTSHIYDMIEEKVGHQGGDCYIAS